jgi:signal transduction histidine kinase
MPQETDHSRRLEERVLVLAPFGHDAPEMCRVLGEAGFDVENCGDGERLCTEIGCGCGAALLAEEALSPEFRRRLAAALAEQPGWSDFPLLLMTSRDRGDREAWHVPEDFEETGHLTLLERPMHTATLISAVRTAIRSRRRQYQVRGELAARARAEKALQELNETLERQIDERTGALAMLRDVASMANHAQDVEEALEYCLRRVAEHNGWAFGHAYLPCDAAPELLLPAYTWYAAEAERFQAFRELTLQTPIRRGEGLPGLVFDGGRPEWSTDVRAELSSRRVGLAEDLGLATAAAFPVMAEDRVVGVLEFFSNKTIERRAEMLESMSAVGLQLGRVIERKAFQDHLLTVADEQHRRIGQELHDDVGQEMTGLALQAETLADLIGSENTPAGKLAQRIRLAAARTHRKTQALSRGLVPMDIEAPALEGALDSLAHRTTEAKGISCRFRYQGDGRVADSQAATQLYRIAQEAVSNAARHSGAGQIEITLTNDEQGTVLEIQDDGRGLPTEEQTPGMGLQIMSYRAKLAGGTLSVESPPSGGTRITCRVLKSRL